MREDACPDTLWSKFSSSRKSVGLALMDQNMFAGVGNIYRAEILYKAGVHPDEPCDAIARETFDALWFHTVQLMQRGFVNGSILTVDPEEALVLGDPWTRRYVYNQKTCGRCRGDVRVWNMANRTVYACETCQPLRASVARRQARTGETAGAERGEKKNKPFVPFVSHCAPDSRARRRWNPRGSPSRSSKPRSPSEDGRGLKKPRARRSSWKPCSPPVVFFKRAAAGGARRRRRTCLPLLSARRRRHERSSPA